MIVPARSSSSFQGCKLVDLAGRVHARNVKTGSQSWILDLSRGSKFGYLDPDLSRGH